MHAYKLSNRQKSSRQLGNCECCGEYASEVWMLVTVEVVPSRRNPGSDATAGGDSLFGHRDCLVGKAA